MEDIQRTRRKIGRRSGALTGQEKLSYTMVRGRVMFRSPKKVKPAEGSNELSAEKKELLKAQLAVIKRSTVIPKGALSKRFK